MLEKRQKVKDVDRIISWLQHDGEGKNPVELSPKEQDKWIRISFADDQLRKGFSIKQTVAMLQKQYKNPSTDKPISLDTAYRIVRECQRIQGEIGIGAKPAAKTIAGEFVLSFLRRAVAAGDLRAEEKAVKMYMDLHKLGEAEAETVPKDALDQVKIYLVVNPEDVGLERYSKEEMDAFYEELTKDDAPRTVDITGHQNEQDE